MNKLILVFALLLPFACMLFGTFLSSYFLRKVHNGILQRKEDLQMAADTFDHLVLKGLKSLIPPALPSTRIDAECEAFEEYLLEKVLTVWSDYRRVQREKLCESKMGAALETLEERKASLAWWITFGLVFAVAVVPAAVLSTYFWRKCRRTGEPEVFQAGKTEVSQAGEAEVSQAGEPEVSQAGEPEVSQAGEAEVSQAGEPEVSQAGEAEVSQAGEPEVSQAGEPEVSQAGEPVVFEELQSEEQAGRGTWGISKLLSDFVAVFRTVYQKYFQRRAALQQEEPESHKKPSVGLHSRMTALFRGAFAAFRRWTGGAKGVEAGAGGQPVASTQA